MHKLALTFKAILCSLALAVALPMVGTTALATGKKSCKKVVIKKCSYSKKSGKSKVATSKHSSKKKSKHVSAKKSKTVTKQSRSPKTVTTAPVQSQSTKTTVKPVVQSAAKPAPARAFVKPAAKPAQPVATQPVASTTKPVVTKPVAQPASAQPATDEASAEKQAQALITRFLDDKDNSLSWLCCVQKLTSILKGQKKYEGLMKDLQALRDEQNATTIGKQLMSHTDLLNEQSASMLDNYTRLQLINLMKKRIQLNGTPCS